MNKPISGKIIGGIIEIAFMLTAFWGINLTMQMDSHGMMQNCPLLGHTQAVCTMTVKEHIVKWQQLFTFTLESNKFLFSALLLVAFAFVLFSSRISLLNLLRLQPSSSRAGPPKYTSGFLLQAFGRGILRKRE